ncbi:MAG: hypothetical protein ACRD4W_13225 [Nitrososphaeraceae archaeon]
MIGLRNGIHFEISWLGSYYEIADKGIYYLQLFGEIEDNLQLLENI